LRELERQILTHDPVLRAGADPLPRPRRLAIAAGLGAALVAVIGAQVVTRREDRVLAAADAVVIFDPRSARVPVAAEPAAIAAGDGVVWVADARDQVLQRIDTARAARSASTSRSHGRAAISERAPTTAALSSTVASATARAGSASAVLNGNRVGETTILSGYPDDKPQNTQWRSVSQILSGGPEGTFLYGNQSAGGDSGGPVYGPRDSAGCAEFCAVAIQSARKANGNGSVGPRINAKVFSDLIFIRDNP
jgi:hypothetical protein